MRSFTTDNFIFIDFTEMDDSMSQKVWECRNRPEIRKWMVNKEPISFESHQKFLNTLKNTNKSLYYSILWGGDLSVR